MYLASKDVKIPTNQVRKWSECPLGAFSSLYPFLSSWWRTGWLQFPSFNSLDFFEDNNIQLDPGFLFFLLPCFSLSLPWITAKCASKLLGHHPAQKNILLCFCFEFYFYLASLPSQSVTATLSLFSFFACCSHGSQPQFRVFHFSKETGITCSHLKIQPGTINIFVHNTFFICFPSKPEAPT